MGVSTIKSSGGDYSSLNAWESAKNADITGLGPEEAECYDFADTTDVGISSWTTTASDYIRIYTPSAQRHDGRSRDVSGTGYQISSSNSSGTIRIGEDYVRIEGIDVKSTVNNRALTISVTPAAGNDLRLHNLICHNSGASSASYVVDVSYTNAVVDVQNTIIYGVTRSIDTRSASAVALSYCTIWNHNDQLGVVADSVTTTKNVYCGAATGSSEDFWTGGTAPSGSHNASSDTSAATDYTSTQVSLAGADQFVSVTAGSEDFTLKSGSGLEGNGTPIGGITLDIIGTTRDSTTPDIGAFEFAVAGTTINATVDALSLTEQAATVNAAKNISVGVDALSLTTYTASVGVGSGITVGVDALTLTEHNATINAARNITSVVDALTLTTYQASVDIGGTNISCGFVPLALTEYQATVVGEAAINPAALIDGSDTKSLAAYGTTMLYHNGSNYYTIN